MSETETLTEPPEDCTCVWTSNGVSGSIFVAMPDCYAWPHPRTYSREEEA